MKKTIVLIALTVGLTLSGCKKYPEGPGLSLNSALKRIAQEWAIAHVDINGFDATATFAGYFYDIKEDGNFTLKTPSGNVIGTWVFNDDKTLFITTQTATSQKDTLTILRLTKKELKTKQTIGSDVWARTMTPKD